MKSKNKQVLDDFVAYCTAHPSERFYQALRNWSGFGRIVGQKSVFPGDFEDYIEIDTFYFTGKNK